MGLRLGSDRLEVVMSWGGSLVGICCTYAVRRYAGAMQATHAVIPMISIL